MHRLINLDTYVLVSFYLLFFLSSFYVMGGRYYKILFAIFFVLMDCNLIITTACFGICLPKICVQRFVCDFFTPPLKAFRFFTHSSFLVREMGRGPSPFHMGYMWVHMLVTCHYYLKKYIILRLVLIFVKTCINIHDTWTSTSPLTVKTHKFIDLNMFIVYVYSH